MSENITALGVAFDGSQLQAALTLLGRYESSLNKSEQKQNANASAIRNSVNAQASFNNTIFKSVGILKQVAGAAGIYLGVQGVIGAFRSVIKTGSEFEQSMANLKAIANVTGKEYDQLNAKVLQMGASTKFTATESANAATEMAKLGLTSKQIVAALGPVLNTASATGESISDVAVTMASTLNQYGLDASEAQRVSDVMAHSFRTSALDLEKYRESMKLAAPLAQLNKIGLEETVAVMATLSNSAIYGSIAGTGFKNVLLKLSDANSKVSKDLKEKGIPVTATFSEKMQELSKWGLDATKTNEYFGRIGLVTAAILIKEAGASATAGKSLSDYEKILKQATGASEEMAKTQLNTFSGAWTLMKSALEDLQIAFFKTFGEDLKKQIKEFTKGVGDLSKWIQKNKETVKDWASAFITVISYSGELLLVLGAAKMGATLTALIGLVSKLALTSLPALSGAMAGTATAAGLLKTSLSVIAGISFGTVIAGVAAVGLATKKALDVVGNRSGYETIAEMGVEDLNALDIKVKEYENAKRVLENTEKLYKEASSKQSSGKFGTYNPLRNRAEKDNEYLKKALEEDKNTYNALRSEIAESLGTTSLLLDDSGLRDSINLAKDTIVTMKTLNDALEDKSLGQVNLKEEEEEKEKENNDVASSGVNEIMVDFSGSSVDGYYKRHYDARQESYSRLLKLDEQYAESNKAISEEYIDTLENDFENQLAMYDKFGMDKTNLVLHYEKLIQDEKGKIRDKEIADDLKAYEEEKKRRQERIGYYMDIGNSVLSMMRSKAAEEEKNAKKLKRIAKMEVTINGARGIMNAWASGNYIENIIETVAIGAATSASYASIDSANYNNGGVVAGANVNRDVVNTNLTPGERVTSRGDRNEIKELVSLVKTIVSNRGDTYNLNASAGTDPMSIMAFRKVLNQVQEQRTPLFYGAKVA
jgi:TP901 family phage tail tape measure protein